MKVRFVLKSFVFSLLLVTAFSFTTNALAVTSTFTASQSVANVTLGLGTVATSTTVANVAETKASTTITIASLPASGTTITIGGCVIMASSTDSKNCNGGTARIATTTSQDGVIGNARTATTFAAAMQGLTYVHNPAASSTTNIIVSASSTSATSVGFSTAASSTETGGNILFTDGTTVVTQSSAPSIKVLGVAPVAMKETITVGGTPSYNDVFSLNSLALNASTTVSTSDITTSNIATNLNADILVDANYNAVGYFTSAVVDNVVTLTAKTTGTAFTAATTTLVNRPAVAQTVVFTPGSITSGETFTITINGIPYSYTAVSDNTATQVSTNLVTALATNSAVNCALVGATVSCVAVAPGTAFTYDATVAAQSRSGGSSSGGGSSSHPAIPPVAPTPNIPFVVTPAGVTPPGIAYIFSSFLSKGSNGASVFALQNRLQREGFLTATPTGYFGPATFAALKAFQKSRGIDPLGIVGPATRAELNKMLTPVGSNASTLTAEARATLIQQITARIQDLMAQINAMIAAQQAQ